MFGVINIIDLFVTIENFHYESNPLVLANPTVFFIIKMLAIYVCLSSGLIWSLDKNERKGKI